MFFDLQSHFNGPDHEGVRDGLERMFADRYRDKRSKFKSKWFTGRGGPSNPESLRDQPPPNMDQQEWSRYIDYYLLPNIIRRSEVNKNVSANQVYQSRHGRIPYAQYRHLNRDPVSKQLPSVIDVYADKHSHDGVYIHSDVAENHRHMVELRDNQAGSQNPLSDEEILKAVLSERPGHVRGIGKKISSTNSTSASETSQGTSQRMYTQAEVDAMFATQQNEIHEKRDQNRRIVQFLAEVGLDMNRPSSSHPTASRSTASRPTASRPTASRPTACRPTASRPTASRSTASRPISSRPTAARPTSSRPTTDLDRDEERTDSDDN